MFPVVNHGVVTYGRHWFDTPAIKKLIGRCKTLVDSGAHAGPRTTRRVALVRADFQGPQLGSNQRGVQLFSTPDVAMNLARAGVVFDELFLEDFASIDQSYDVYIFQNAFYVPAAQRDALRRKLSADGATAVWLYAPGYMDEKGSGLAGVEALSGLTLAVEHGDAVVQMVQPDAEHSLFADVGSFGSGSVARSYTSDVPLQEHITEYDAVTLPATFYCDDPDSEPLAVLEPSGKVGMARKEVDGFTSIWIGVPEVPWQLWRNLLCEVGVHVYCEGGDFLMANDRFVSVYCITGGDKRMSLPARCQVSDALSGLMLADSTDALEFKAKAGETRSFVLVRDGMDS
jgi:hypothetical protein